MKNTMKYLVVAFEDDGMVSAIPSSWMTGSTVRLPPLKENQFSTAVANAMPPIETWEEYEAKLLTRADTYEVAAAYAKKFANANEDSDTSPCRGIEHRRRPRPIKRYTPNPTDEEPEYVPRTQTPPLLESTLLSHTYHPSTTAAVEYPVMRLNSASTVTYNPSNVTMPGEKETTPVRFDEHQAMVDVIQMTMKSLKDEICSSLTAQLNARMEEVKQKIGNEMKDIRLRLDNIDKHVASLDELVHNYHSDVLHTSDDQISRKPRWRPWFPLNTTDELMSMEHNLINENCKADVVSFAQRTPAGTIDERIKWCLRRIMTDDLSRKLSWKQTPDKLPFGTTCLWSTISETFSASPSDQALARKVCVAWFQNARDRSGGRAKRRLTCPDMPLLERTNENIQEQQIPRMNRTLL